MKTNFKICKHIGKLCEFNNGYTKEFNLVSWNNREPVYDIRTWNKEYKEFKDGVKITQNEMLKLKRILNQYFHIEDKSSKFIYMNTEIYSEELRSKYIDFISQLKNGNFNQELYDLIFNALYEEITKCEIEKTVPIRIFRVCIDLIYVLSFDNLPLSNENKQRVKDIQDEIYGLLMGF